MRICIGDKTVAAQFVAAMLTDSAFDSALITIILQARSEACYVSIVTDTSLEDIVEKKVQNFFGPLIDTSSANIVVG